MTEILTRKRSQDILLAPATNHPRGSLHVYAQVSMRVFISLHVTWQWVPPLLPWSADQTIPTLIEGGKTGVATSEDGGGAHHVQVVGGRMRLRITRTTSTRRGSARAELLTTLTPMSVPLSCLKGKRAGCKAGTRRRYYRLGREAGRGTCFRVLRTPFWLA